MQWYKINLDYDFSHSDEKQELINHFSIHLLNASPYNLEGIALVTKETFKKTLNMYFSPKAYEILEGELIKYNPTTTEAPSNKNDLECIGGTRQIHYGDSKILL